MGTQWKHKLAEELQALLHTGGPEESETNKTMEKEKVKITNEIKFDGVWVVIFKMFKIIDTILINQIIMYTILIVWNPRGCHNTDHKRLNSKQTDIQWRQRLH